MGKIARKSKFEGQLKAKLKKFKTSDLFTKCAYSRTKFY